MGSEDEVTDTPRLIRIDTAQRQIHEILPGTTRIGRSRDFEISLEETSVSRFHCYLLRQGNVVRLFEGESKNKARIDGIAADGQTLEQGQVLEIGTCRFVYEGPPATRSQESPVALGRSTPPPRRRRRVARAARQQPAFLTVAVVTVLGLILIGLAIWLPRHLEQPQPLTAGTEEMARKLDASQLQIESILARLNQQKASPEELASLRATLEAEKQRNNELRLELERERELDRQRRSPAGEVSTANQQSGLLHPELDSAPDLRRIGPDDPGGTGTSTVVVRTDRPTTERSAKEVKDLVAILCSRIDDYATHLVTPASLEPELTELSSTTGRAGAVGVLQVHAHTRDLIRQTEASIEANKRRKDRLLVEARQTIAQGTPLEGSGTKDDPASKKDEPRDKDKDKDKKKKKKAGYHRAVGDGAEKSQRLIDASAAAADIHTRHRAALLPLRDAVVSSIKRLTNPEALAYWRERFIEESDPELLKGVLAAFVTASHRDSIPVLTRRLGTTSDAPLKAAIHRSLTKLAGVDLGDKPGPWAAWWSQRDQ